jgi:hypothetical protein
VSDGCAVSDPLVWLIARANESRAFSRSPAIRDVADHAAASRRWDDVVRFLQRLQCLLFLAFRFCQFCQQVVRHDILRIRFEHGERRGARLFQIAGHLMAARDAEFCPHQFIAHLERHFIDRACFVGLA